MRTGLKRVLCAVALILLGAGLAPRAKANPITVSSYVYDAGSILPHASYPDTGTAELRDGTIATPPYSQPNWVGFNDSPDTKLLNNPAITFDLGAVYYLNRVTISYLVDTVSVIYPPTMVVLSFSDDNVSFTGGPWATNFATSAGTQSNVVSLTGFSGRYVKLAFANAQTWTFLTEVAFDGVSTPPAAGPVSATGGTETNYNQNGTNWTARIFTTVGSNNLDVSSGGDVEVLVVGGGGGGGETIGGGGGAGGYIHAALTLTSGVYTVMVGDGGAGGWGSSPAYPPGTKGGNSVFWTLTAMGGGAGAGYNSTASDTGGSAGGDGGGGGARAGYTFGQGNDGGVGYNNNVGGGGGGAGQAGAAGSSGGGGKGGDGITNSITGVATVYAGGGGRRDSGANRLRQRRGRRTGGRRQWKQFNGRGGREQYGRWWWRWRLWQ